MNESSWNEYSSKPLCKSSFVVSFTEVLSRGIIVKLIDWCVVEKVCWQGSRPRDCQSELRRLPVSVAKIHNSRMARLLTLMAFSTNLYRKTMFYLTSVQKN